MSNYTVDSTSKKCVILFFAGGAYRLLYAFLRVSTRTVAAFWHDKRMCRLAFFRHFQPNGHVATSKVYSLVKGYIGENS